MKNFCFLLIVLFIETLTQNNTLIKVNPIFLVNNENPFVLSTTDDYYYVITKGTNLKIDKKSGDIYNTSENFFIDTNYIYFFDNSNNNYVYYLKEYYKIINQPFILFEKFVIKSKPKGGDSEGIPLNKDLIGSKEDRNQNEDKDHIISGGHNDEDLDKSHDNSLNNINNMTIVGGIAKENEFIIYGYGNNHLLFLNQSQEYIAQLRI